MTKEEKDIIIKDLCTRLPYSVMLETDNAFPQKLEGIAFDKGDAMICVSDGAFTLDWMTCRPYLLPVSSMTEDQWNNAPRGELTKFTFESLKCGGFTLASYTCDNDLNEVVEFVNWLIANHFDVHGLIPKGLAKDATGLDIY